MPTIAGRPKVYNNEEDLFIDFLEYIEYCRKEERLPNIAGLVRYLGIGRTTFYDYKKVFPNTIKQIEDILEDEAINCKAINDTFKIFYMKNKFSSDYKDRQEIDLADRRYDVEG